ncbi:hypothetical protein ACTXT7_016124, partial [Hymenolepis weldensis]
NTGCYCKDAFSPTPNPARTRSANFCYKRTYKLHRIGRHDVHAIVSQLMTSLSQLLNEKFAATKIASSDDMTLL